MAYERQMDYIDVATRLTEMRDKFPDLTMTQVNMEFVVVAGTSWVVYTAAAYRTPDDPRPGIGTAWEPIPGPTPFTKDSEVQNAETAAWGRALIAIGASTKNGIASHEEVTNRSGNTPSREPGEYVSNRKVTRLESGNAPEPYDYSDNRPTGTPYVHGSGNDDFDQILQAATLSDNDFIHDLARQIESRGSLSNKQLVSGVKAAFKIMNS
jgi:hypothetical protein